MVEFRHVGTGQDTAGPLPDLRSPPQTLPGHPQAESVSLKPLRGLSDDASHFRWKSQFIQLPTFISFRNHDFIPKFDTKNKGWNGDMDVRFGYGRNETSQSVP